MSVMALYRYIVTQPDKELVLENEAASDAFAYRERGSLRRRVAG